MKLKWIVLLLILPLFLIIAGCTTSQPADIKSDQAILQDSESDISKIPDKNLQEKIDSSVSEEIPDKDLIITDGATLQGFITRTFPRLTDEYHNIQKSRVALNWKEAQNAAHSLELSAQEIIEIYKLNQPNPEKNSFKGLNSKEEIILKKYIGYISDIGEYAANLKQAIYWQEQETGDESGQKAKHYQDLADEFEKKMITDIKLVFEYGNDFKYQYLESKLMDNYSYYS